MLSYTLRQRPSPQRREPLPCGVGGVERYDAAVGVPEGGEHITRPQATAWCKVLKVWQGGGGGAYRCVAESAHAACATRVRGFLMTWPSSSTTRCQRTWNSRPSSPYLRAFLPPFLPPAGSGREHQHHAWLRGREGQQASRAAGTVMQG